MCAVADEVEVRVVFEFPETKKYPAFRDALTLPLDEYNAMSDDELERRKQERYDAWRDLFDNPPEPKPTPEPEPLSEEERQAQMAALVADLAQLTEQVQGLVGQSVPQETTATEG